MPAETARPMDEAQFRVCVIQKLTKLETQMAMLVGNGQPGRIAALEKKARWHDRLLWMAIGAGAFIGWVAKYLAG